MDRDALLRTTRDEFLRAFVLAVDRALPRAAATLLRRAETTLSVTDQRRLLSAHQLFRECETELNKHLRHNLDLLLDRSFQTTYGTFSPALTDSFTPTELTQLDPTVHVDLLRINEVTARFRHAADNPLRDLTIRIARLFDQDRINERDNPFRPFLLSRALASAIDNLGQQADINSTLFDQLADDMRSEITVIYDAVNTLLASHGVAATTDHHEQMTIDVVAMLFDFIRRDPQIPVDVRAQLARLQFLVLKIALHDSALLTDKNHPVRLLMNRIGAVSVGLNQTDPLGVHVIAEIRRVVDALLTDQREHADLFPVLLEQFDAFITQALRGSDSPVDLAVVALEKARHRTLRLARLKAGLAEGLDGLNIDPFLDNFLTTTWIRAIERAERHSDTAGLRLRQLVPDLLWSVIPKHLPAQRQQLLGMLPGLVDILRDGMLQAKMSGIERLDVLNWLVEVHSRALRGTVAGGPDLMLDTLQQRFALFTNAPDRGTSTVPIAALEVAGTDPHSDDFLIEALHETNAALVLLDPMLEQDAPESSVDVQEDTNSILARLRSGVAMTIMLGTLPSSGRLHWIDQHTTTLLLQLDDHPAPSMLSVQLFLHLHSLGRAGFSETAPLFERAVHTLI